MEVGGGGLHVTLLDIPKRRVIFEQHDVHHLNWERVRGALTEADPNKIDVRALEHREQNAQFFVEQVRQRLSAGSEGEKPFRVLLVLSGPTAFNSGEDMHPIETGGDPNTKVYYLRYHVPPERPTLPAAVRQSRGARAARFSRQRSLADDARRAVRFPGIAAEASAAASVRYLLARAVSQNTGQLAGRNRPAVKPLTLRPQPLAKCVGSPPGLTSFVPREAGYQDHGEGGCGETQRQKNKACHCGFRPAGPACIIACLQKKSPASDALSRSSDSATNLRIFASDPKTIFRRDQYYFSGVSPGAPVFDEPRNSFLPSAKVTSRPLALFEPSFD